MVWDRHKVKPTRRWSGFSRASLSIPVLSHLRRFVFVIQVSTPYIKKFNSIFIHKICIGLTLNNKEQLQILHIHLQLYCIFNVSKVNKILPFIFLTLAHLKETFFSILLLWLVDDPHVILLSRYSSHRQDVRVLLKTVLICCWVKVLSILQTVSLSKDHKS